MPKKWNVQLTKKAQKNIRKLPPRVTDILSFLLSELETLGPIRGNWKNYSKLSKNKHHCHLKAGKPTFVACWEVKNDKITLEVYYVGTHEKAPY